MIGRILGAWRERRSTTRSGYADRITQAMVRAAEARPARDPAETAAVVGAAHAVGMALAGAELDPPNGRVARALPAALRAMIGRELVRRGEWVGRIRLVEGAVVVDPVSRATITGAADPSTWMYTCTIAGPSSSRTEEIPADGVLHFRWGAYSTTPWVGVPPYPIETARLLAEVEVALADEASGPRGQILPMPRADGLDGLRREMTTLAGRVAMPETTADGYGEGMSAAPRRDWVASRLGAAPPDSLVALRAGAEAAVIASIGVPPELITGAATGSAGREALRRLVAQTLDPLALCIADEVAVKLDESVAISFSRIGQADLHARARAVQSLAGAGVDVGDARRISGL